MTLQNSSPQELFHLPVLLTGEKVVLLDGHRVHGTVGIIINT